MSSDGGGGESRGILQSLRRVAATALALVITRGELAAVELAEAREQVARWAVGALLGAVLLLAALLSASLLVAALFWETYRWQAIGTLVLAYAVVGVWLMLKVMREVRAAPPLLSATLAELARDREALAASREPGP